MSEIDNVSIIIKTFERRVCLDRLLTSIKKQSYGCCPILIADDSENPYDEYILKKHGNIIDRYIKLPFDSGVSKGRNKLLEEVDTDFFIVNDDDFVYHKGTKIEKALKKIRNCGYDILAGNLLEKKRVFTTKLLPRRLSNFLGLYKETWEESGWTAELTINDDDSVEIKNSNNEKSEIHECDIVTQFFIARTDRVYDNTGGWNPKIKTFGEHWEFFYRAKKAGLDVARYDEWSVLHVPENNTKYYEYRKEREKETILKSIRCSDIPYLIKNNKIYKP